MTSMTSMMMVKKRWMSRFLKSIQSLRTPLVLMSKQQKSLKKAAGHHCCHTTTIRQDFCQAIHQILFSSKISPRHEQHRIFSQLKSMLVWMWQSVTFRFWNFCQFMSVSGSVSENSVSEKKSRLGFGILSLGKSLSFGLVTQWDVGNGQCFYCLQCEME